MLQKNFSVRLQTTVKSVSKTGSRFTITLSNYILCLRFWLIVACFSTQSYGPV